MLVIVNNINYSSSSVPGIANGVGSKAFVVDKDYALMSTSPHELGHCLNLLHTHSQTYGIETIPRTGSNANCTTAGDQLCDTPADPRLISDSNNSNYNVNSNCEYFGGGGYTPDTHNMMSYSYKPCRDRFSVGQELRMRDAIAAYPFLQDVINNSCSLFPIIGDDQFCASSQSVFSIGNVIPPYNWTVSSNLEIVSNNGSSITVQATNNQEIGVGSVEVTYTGGISNKEIWIGTVNEGIDAFTIMDDLPVYRVETVDVNGYQLQWRVNGISINDNGESWIDIDLSEYGEYCEDNQTELSVRQDGECGWSNYDSRYFNCLSNRANSHFYF